MRLALLVCGVSVVMVGCTKTVSTRTVQPNPMMAPASVETLRVSKQLALDVGDLELPQYKDRTQSTWAPGQSHCAAVHDAVAGHGALQPPQCCSLLLGSTH